MIVSKKYRQFAGQYKKIVCLVLSLALLTMLCAELPFLSLEPIKAYADDIQPTITGSTATGADFSYEHDVQTIDLRAFGVNNRATADASVAIQSALDFAWHYSNDGHMVKINVPNGNYLLNNKLFIHSNTWLSCDDDVNFIRNNDNGSMLLSYIDGAYGYDGIHNVIIEGGVWDGNTKKYGINTFSTIRFAHGRNILFKNTSVINNNNGHHVEVGGVRDLTFEGCYFSGYMGELQKECIQLDTMNSAEVFGGYEPFDDTACENVVIRNNQFVDCCRAFGSHSATMGVYYDNILIEDNYCRNLESIAMIMFNYKNCTIRNNTIDGCSSAFELKNISSKPDSNIHTPAVMSIEEAKSRVDGFSNTIIENNDVTVNARASRDKYCCGVMLTGDNVTTANQIPNMIYDIGGVSVTNNIFRTPATTIIMTYAFDCVFSSNTFEVTNNAGFTNKNSIYVENADRITFDHNKISGAIRNGLYGNKSNNLVVTNNDITGAGNNNISLNFCKDFSLSGNNINSAVVNGGYISTGSSGSIENNHFENNRNNGVTVFASNVSINSNEFKGMGQNAINFTDSASGSATGNTLDSTGLHGIYVHKNSKNINIADNYVTGCKNNGIYVTNGANSGMNVNGNKVENCNYGIAVSNNSIAYLSANSFGKITKKPLYLGDNAKMNISYEGTLDSEYGAGCVKLSYPVSTPNSQYEIYRMAGGEKSYKKIATTSAVSYVDSGLKSSTLYNYKVRAVDKTIGKTTVATNYLSSVGGKTQSAVHIASVGIDPTVKSYSWTGSQIKPSFNIVYQNRSLKKGADYTVTYSNNTNVGTATATIKGINGFTGSVKVKFNIALKKQSIKKLSPSKTAVAVTWTTHKAAGGYQIIVSKSKNFSTGNKTVTLSGYSTIKKTITSLSKSTTYYVKVRDFKKVGTKTVYGAWSDVKTVKTTK